MIEHRHVIFVLAVVKVAKRDVTAVRSLRQNVTGLKGRALRTPCPNHDLPPFSMTMHPRVIW